MDYIALSKENVMSTYASFPIVIDHGKGSLLYDVEGKEYIDCVAGIAVNALGYDNPDIKAQIDKVLSDGFLHVSNLYYNKWAPVAAEKLNKLAGSKKVFFANSGAEANEAALKLVRKYGAKTNRHQVIAFNHSFHGRTYGAITLTGQEKYHKGFAPMVPEIVYADFNDLESVHKCNLDSTAAIFVEPIQGEGGIIPATESFLKGLREICDEKDILLVFDCVQCGLGRSGKNFAFEHYDIKPDVFTLAKAIGCGVPFSATVAFEKAADVLSPGDHASTFGANALSSAMSLVLFDKLESGLAKSAAEKGEYFIKGLKAISQKYPEKCGDVRGMGLMLGMVLKVPPRDVISKCIEKGLLVCSAGYDVLRFVPPLVISYDEIDKALSIVDEAISEV